MEHKQQAYYGILRIHGLAGRPFGVIKCHPQLPNHWFFGTMTVERKNTWDMIPYSKADIMKMGEGIEVERMSLEECIEWIRAKEQIELLEVLREREGIDEESLVGLGFVLPV